jgi:CheY-like chemotaxis protein
MAPIKYCTPATRQINIFFHQRTNETISILNIHMSGIILSTSPMRIGVRSSGPRKMERAMGRSREKILCIEDEPDTCRMLQVLLPDFELISASTKAEAVERAREGNFALIFMDYLLPDGTGEEACRMIRYFDQKTPILFITGYATFTETKARSIGAQGTLKKASPTFVDELKHRTSELALCG